MFLSLGAYVSSLCNNVGCIPRFVPGFCMNSYVLQLARISSVTPMSALLQKAAIWSGWEALSSATVLRTVCTFIDFTDPIASLPSPVL